MAHSLAATSAPEEAPQTPGGSELADPTERDVCREFGISRKTGYKIFARDKAHGSEALTDRSRRPVRYANQLPHQIERLIVRLKREKPHWGVRKIRELLVRRLDRDLRIPATRSRTAATSACA